MRWTDAAVELEEMHEACRDVACPRCGSGRQQRCVNPVTKRDARVPCLARVRALDLAD